MMTPEDREAASVETEQNRQASQAGAERHRAANEAETARERAEAQQATADLDPNSPEGRQAAIGRGDPVQLTGEEAARGMVRGTSTTSNESGAGFPASDEHRFVTGAAGMPIPESAGVSPQRPGDVPPNEDERDMSLHPDVPVSAQEKGQAALEEQRAADAQPPAKSATKAEWVDHAVSQGADRDEAESMTKDQLIEEHGA
jgi:hypothetical protein